MIKFSFIVPVYNISKQYLDECVQSLVSQTYPDYEIVIVDDGSTNGCDAWCDGWAKQKNCIQSIHQKNAGVSTARNTGIQHAQGAHLIFVDPDDWIEATMLEKIDRVLQSHDCDVLIHSYMYEYISCSVPENDAVQGTVEVLSDAAKRELIVNLVDTERKTVYKTYQGKAFGSVWAKCFRKEFIIGKGITFQKDLKKAQDSIFNLWAMQQADQIVVYNEPLYHYRMVKGSITHRYNKDIIQIQMLFLQAVRKFIRQNDVNPEMDEAFVHRCILSYFSMIDLDMFHPNNKESYWQKRKRWMKLRKNAFIRSFTMNAIKKYSVKTQAVLLLTKAKLFGMLYLFFIAKRKFLPTQNTDQLYD